MLLDREKSGVLLVDVQEKVIPLVVDHHVCIENCRWILDVAQILNIPIFTSEQYPKGLGFTLPIFEPFIDAEKRINKVAFSVMHDPKGRQLLLDSKKTHWVLVGIETHVCMLQTAMDLKSQGFEVFVVAEASSARTTLDKDLALSRMQAAGIQIISREMAAFEWLKVAGTPLFKKISEEFIK